MLTIAVVVTAIENFSKRFSRVRTWIRYNGKSFDIMSKYRHISETARKHFLPEQHPNKKNCGTNHELSENYFLGIGPWFYLICPGKMKMFKPPLKYSHIKKDLFCRQLSASGYRTWYRFRFTSMVLYIVKHIFCLCKCTFSRDVQRRIYISLSFAWI